MPSTNSIEELSLAAIDVKSTYFDFRNGFGFVWDEITLGLLQCNFCGATYIDETYTNGDPCPDEECADTHDGTLDRPECAPMMNYYYDLPYYKGNPQDDQMTLYQSSASIVLVRMMGIDDNEDTYVLALSGGGMDLSWDICHAYILLGYAPPIEFCHLPDFAGQDNRKEPFWTILKACLKSTKAAEKRAERQTGQLYQRINDALKCPECGHPDPHQVPGCNHVEHTLLGENRPPQRCSCTYYSEDRPVDAEAVRTA